MGKEFWGPSVWRTFHSFAAEYNYNNSYVFQSFVNSFIFLLPCLECRKNFEKHLERLPLKKYLKDRDSVFYWSYLIHDLVNKQLGKKSPSFLTIKKLYYKNTGEMNLCKKC